MRALVKLFGRSPFAPLRSHMERVTACVDELNPLFDAVQAENGAEVAKLAKKISKLEHEADLAKNDIRNGLKSSLFLPVDRRGLLDILTIQDDLADKAEDIAILLTFRAPKPLVGLEEIFTEFLRKNLEAFHEVAGIIAETQELLETTFGGSEAKRIRARVENVALMEHNVDVVQRTLLKELFNREDHLSYAAFHLWNRVIEEVGGLSNLAEKLANHILMTMEMK